MKAATFLATVLFATPAHAWQVERTKDRMTDRTETWASSTAGDARLLVGCLNGAVTPRLVWDKRIGWGTIGVSYRVDDGPVVPRMAMVSDDGRTLYAWPMDGAAVLKARRVRVSISGNVYDFDVGAGERLPAIRCAPG